MHAGDSAASGLPGNPWWSVVEMHKLARSVLRNMPALRAPCLVMHARNDDIASVSNAYEIQRRAVNAPVTLQLLDDSYHMITIDRERRVVIARAAAFVTELVEGAKPGAAPMWNEAMTPLVVTLWILNLLFDSVGQLIFKAAAVDPKLGEGAGRWRRMARRPWLWLGIGCYVLEFVLWLAFISLVPLSDGVLLGSISIVVVMLLGRVFFRERLTPLRVLGILLVSLGVGIVGLKGKAMRRFYLIGFLALMAFDTLAQISFKVAGEHALPLEFSPAWLLRVFGQPWIYGAFIGYLGAFFTWMVLLKHAPIGPAFAASYLEIVAVLVISAVWFGEPIGWPQILGTVLILGGICCLAVSESSTVPKIEHAGQPARHGA